VGVEHLFTGSALGTVGADGAVPLPAFVRRVLDSCGAGRMMVGAHESDLCLTAYEPGYVPVLQADIERRRLRDEALGAPAENHHARARRAFGFVEDAQLRDGRVLLPAMMRSKGRIAQLALFVGTGGSFEIWNPHLAREAGDEALRELAEFRLGQRGPKFKAEEDE
jgi:MraZ protein